MAENQNATDPQQPARPRWQEILLNPYLMLALAGLFWSGNHIAGRIAAGQIPPMSLAGVRWLIGAAILYPFVHRHLREDWPLMVRHWRIMLFLCLSGGAIFAALQYTALNYTTALNAAIANSLSPIVIAIAGAILYRDRLNGWQSFGVAVSLIGVLALVSRADLDVIRSLTFNIGDIYLVINMAIWGLYSACLRDRPPIHPLTFTFMLALVAGLALIPGYIYEYAIGANLVISWPTVSVVLYVSIFPSILGYICWNRGIEAVGAARGGIFLHLVPVYGVILATLLLGERLMPFHIAGFVLIIFGVWLTSRRYGPR